MHLAPLDSFLLDHKIKGMPGAIVTSNLIAGNYIARNGADVADNATPGPTEINIDAGASGEPLTGNTVTGNIIEQEAVDVAVRTSAQIDIHLNDLLGGGVGVDNQGSGIVNATQNYWGSRVDRVRPAARRSQAT